MNGTEEEKADALDHIARALSAIDHNLEVVAKTAERQSKAVEAIAQMLPRLLQSQ
jgi:hypothetical protein